MSLTFFIDLDDTLLPNQHYYKIQGAKALRLVVEQLYPENRRVKRAARQLIAETVERGYRVPPLLNLIEEVEGDTSLLEAILRKNQEIELEMIPHYKAKGEPYHRERFPTSWQETYLYFCKEQRRFPDDEVARHVYDTAASFWDIKPGLMWGAVS